MTEKPRGPVYSQDYWDIVTSQISRRPSVVISMFLLGFLYAVAIFAPFIANDRPLYFNGTDRVSYRKAQREIGLAGRSLADHLEQGPQAFGEAHGGTTPGVTWASTVKSEAEAVDLRVFDLNRQLAPADRALILELDEAVKTAARLAKSQPAPAAGAAAEIRGLVDRVQSELSPAAAGEAAVPGRTVRLVPFTAWPVVQNLSRGEIYFMTLMALLLLWPFVNRVVNGAILKGDRLAIRRARRVKALAFVVLPVVAALVWTGRSGAFYMSPYKDGLTSG